MFNSVLATNYARTLYDVAEDNDTKNKILEQTKLFLKFQDTEIFRILKIPILSNKKKFELVDILKNEIDMLDEIGNLMKILIEVGKINYLFEIFLEYQNIFQEKENIQIVNISIARPLKNNLFEEIRVNLEQKFNKFIVLLTTVDDSLIGGIKIEFNGKILDNTIKKYLRDLVIKS